MTYIVCAWHTPEYRTFADALRRSLVSAGAPHDIIETACLSGGWERNTRRKASFAREFMSRYPDLTVVQIDADCVVAGTHAEIEGISNISGDLGVRSRIAISRFRPRPKYWLMSGTLVLKPTDGARALVDAWSTFEDDSPRFATDQDSLLRAVASVPNATVSFLPAAACATASDLKMGVKPIFQHFSGAPVRHKATRMEHLVCGLRDLMGRCA